ncbi:hypothetical protein VDGL01_06263 [Verticillium dahliae]
MILCVLTSGDNAFNAPASSLPPPLAPAWHNPQRVHRNSTLVLPPVSAVRGPVTPHRLPARHRLRRRPTHIRPRGPRQEGRPSYRSRPLPLGDWVVFCCGRAR